MFSRFKPRVVAAQRLQSLLLVTALAAGALSALLVLDLVSGMRSVAISEAENALTAALRDLADAAREWENAGGDWARVAGLDDEAERELRLLSYRTLEPHNLVEGGYFVAGARVGHSFPIHTEPGSSLLLPEVESEATIAAIEASRAAGGAVAHRVFMDSTDLVVVSALADPASPAAAWALKRFIDFSDPRQTRHQAALAALVAVSLLSAGGVLLLSFRLQRGFAEIEAGLREMRSDLSRRIPEQNHELRPIARAINDMAAARERLEADLRREDRLRLLGRVVAGIAHEIKNPLNSIRIMMQGLARTREASPLVSDTAASVVQEVDRLTELLRNLLAFRGEDPPRPIEQPLAPVVERCLAIVAPQASERGVRLESSLDGSASARFDADQLQQAVLNLLLNALDAAGERGSVRVETARSNGSALVRVVDSGPGLAAHQEDRVFEGFYTTKANGTGLGLMVTRSLIERMGGAVCYEGGKNGAAFSIRLPAN